MERVRIHILGDSTAANKLFSAFPERGWGQEVPAFFSEYVRVMNHAMNGRSTKSFIDEGRLDKALACMQNGDYVIIQFGHNDQKTDSPERFASIEDYQRNLRKMIQEVRQKGATPILLTSIYRRYFDEGKIRPNAHQGYPKAMKDVALELNVHCIDMCEVTRLWLEKLGDEESKQFYMIFDRPVGRYPSEMRDNTHLTVEGAYLVASMVIAELKKLPLHIKDFIIA